MDVHSIAAAICVALLVMAMGAVIYSDATRYIISNRLNLCIIALYAIAATLLPVGLPWSLAAFALVVMIGLGMFALGLMGGGDVKLLAALSLWTGWNSATLVLFFMTAVTGGALALIILLTRKFYSQPRLAKNPERTLARILTPKEPIPYGLAIATAFVWLLLIHGVPPLA